MSVDISLYNEDIAIIKTGLGEQGNTYDIILEDAPASSTNLLRRSVVTPPKWIAKWAIERGGIVHLDSSYGDKLYNQLSDPLTYQWISDAYANVKEATSYVDDNNIQVNSITVAVPDGDTSSSTVNVLINYSVDGEDIVENLVIGETHAI
jgi:hypothetical protein